MTTNNLIIENFDFGVRLIKVSRVHALNALNTETLKSLMVALQEAEKDASVRAVVLTGDGNKAFIAGADISEMKDKSSFEATTFSQLGHEVTKHLEHMAKPTIAAVHGFALGGGLELALGCDFIIASEAAIFGLPEVGLGVIPGFGGTARLAKFVGVPRAKEMIFSGRKIEATEALRFGICTQVLSVDNFLNNVVKIAQKITNNSAPAVCAAKKLLNEYSEFSGLGYKLDSEAQEFGALFGTRDQKEGMSAFVEKRKPEFEGVGI
jgi:enoyl-CoA hydratase